MILVVLSFVIGVNGEKLVCESYRSRRLFRVNTLFYSLWEDSGGHWGFSMSCGLLQEQCKNMGSLLLFSGGGYGYRGLNSGALNH